MYCATCGSANQDGATFCKSCGAAVSAPAITAPSTNPPGPPQPPQVFAPPAPATHLLPPPQPLATAPRTSRRLVPVMTAVAVIAVAGVVTYAWIAGRSVPQTPSGSATSVGPAAGTGAVAAPTPREYVSAYYQAILDKDWQKAFDMQPAASKAGQTAAAFGETQDQYGMKAFSVFSDVVAGVDATVVVRQDLGENGIWNTTWTLVSTNGSWVATSRKVALGEPE